MKHIYTTSLFLLFSSNLLFSSYSNGSFYCSPGTSQQHSRSIGKQIASAIPVISLARAGFGLIKRIFSDSPKKRRCDCQDQDLCRVKKMANSDIQKLCDQLYASCLPDAAFMGSGSYQQSSFEFRWNELELDCLSMAAQSKLRERVYKEHNRRTQVRISQEQERQRQKELAKQRVKEKRIAPQKPVQQRFVSNKDNVEKYAHATRSKKKKRPDAIRRALDNNFCIIYKQYELSFRVTKLLEQNNINAKNFQECVGNATQQQIHQEFIDVLNNGANLYFSQEISHLTDQWYGVLSNVSFIGSSINNIGHFVLAHEIADLCEGLCQIEKRKVSSCFDCSEADYVQIEELWNSTLTYVGNALQRGGDKVVRFTEGIQDKAIGRTARFLTELACLFKNNPKEVFEIAGSILLESVQHVFDSAQLVEALATDPFSESTFELVSDFGTAYVESVGKKVTKAALIFWQMPAEEKAQEVVALGLQVFAVVGVTKLLAALPAQAALLKSSALLKLDQLSQTTGPVMQTGISPDGTVNIALQAVEQMSEELVAVAEEAIVIAAGAQAKIATTAIADSVSTMALAVRDVATSIAGGSAQPIPPQIPDDKLAEKIAENIEAIQKMKEQGIEVSPEYERLALEGRQLLRGGRAVDAGATFPYMPDQEAEELRTLFIKELGGEETFKKLGLEGATIDNRFIKHILSPEIKTMVTRAGTVSKKLSGCHFIDKELVEAGCLRYEVLNDGLIKRVRIFCNGVSEQKTIWPFEWTKDDIITKIAQSFKKLANTAIKDDFEKIAGEIETITVDGIKLVTALDKNNRFITSYPIREILNK